MKDVASFDLFNQSKRRLFIRRIAASRGKPQRFGIYNRTQNGYEQLFAETLQYRSARELLLKLRKDNAN